MVVLIPIYLFIACIISFFIWLMSSMGIFLDGYYVESLIREYIFVCNTLVYEELYDEINIVGIIILEIIVTLFTWPAILANAATTLVTMIACAIASLYKKIFAKKKDGDKE